MKKERIYIVWEQYRFLLYMRDVQLDFKSLNYNVQSTIKSVLADRSYQDESEEQTILRTVHNAYMREYKEYRSRT